MIHAIEICSCAGGMALGFRRAGIEFALAIDKDPDACTSYEHNLGHRPLRLDVHDLLRLVVTGWRPTPGLDLVVADPPCQPWSSAGSKRGLADSRDCLRPVVEIVRILQPAAFLLGNVPGLKHQNAAEQLRDTVGVLSYCGYCIDHVVLDAADYGVPQHRVRPFWYAHRGGPCIAWPSPTHGRPTTQLPIGGTELVPWVTCRDALGDLPLAELGKVRRLKRNKRDTDGGGHPWSELDEPAHVICARRDGGHGGGDVLAVGRRRIPDWPWDRPSTTVTTEERIAAPGHKSVDRRTFDECVVLSERARSRLQGFPDWLCDCNGGYAHLSDDEHHALLEDVGMTRSISEVCQDCWLPRRPWRFIGKTKGSRNAQIGMAMPPSLAEAIARSVVHWFADASDDVEDFEPDEQREYQQHDARERAPRSGVGPERRSPEECDH